MRFLGLSKVSSAAVLTMLALAGCAASSKQAAMSKQDPNFELNAECGGRLALFVLADTSLKLRIENNITGGEVPQRLIVKSLKDHPSFVYINLIENQVGTSQISEAAKRHSVETANLVAAAKSRNGGNMILANREIISILASNATGSCARAGYGFSEIKSIAPAPAKIAALENKEDAAENKNGVQRVQAESLPLEAKRPEQLRDRLSSPDESNSKASAQLALEEQIARTKKSVRPVNQKERSAMTKAIERRLTDPESVRYRDSAAVPGGDICVEVNAKNRLGGYAGFQSFVVSKVGEEYISMGGSRLPLSDCIDIIVEWHAKRVLKISE